MGYDDWVAVIAFWLEQLSQLQGESSSMLFTGFLWISRVDVRVGRVLGAMGGAHRGRRLRRVLLAVVARANSTEAMHERQLCLSCDLEKRHLDAHRRQGRGVRVSSRSDPVLRVARSCSPTATSSTTRVPAPPPSPTDCELAMRLLASASTSLRVEFLGWSRRRRQAEFGRPWSSTASDGASCGS